MDNRLFSRRNFLKAGFQLGAGASLSLLLADRLVANPLARVLGVLDPLRTVRVRGTVTSGKTPLAGIAVTDGRSVAHTDAQGRYELLADASRPFVYLSLPAGQRIPQNPGQATARFYAPLSTEKPEWTHNWVLEPLPQSDANHRFYVFADPQPRTADDLKLYHTETIADARAFHASLPPQETFAVGCGDIMWDDLTLLPGYEAAMRDLAVPAFSVVGNHDLDMQDVRTDEASVRTFERFFGPTYYSFDRGEVHYVVLDNVFWYGRSAAGAYMGYLDELQLGWLKQDLQGLPAGKTVVVFTHIPIYCHINRYKGQDEEGSIVTVNRALLYELLRPFKTHFINGHMHWTEQHTDGGFTHHTCGAACGAWWSGPICYDGTPSGYGVYEVTGSSFRWAYKGTGLPLEQQLRLYAPGADPKAPHELVANVWSATPDWQIVWYEDGIRKGRMAARIGHDPLSVQLHEGNKLPTKHTWVDPEPNNHLYYAPVAAGAAQVRVEATDPWGRVYTAAL